jgi:hypothetical protein
MYKGELAAWQADLIRRDRNPECPWYEISRGISADALAVITASELVVEYTCDGFGIPGAVIAAQEAKDERFWTFFPADPESSTRSRTQTARLQMLASTARQLIVFGMDSSWHEKPQTTLGIEPRWSDSQQHFSVHRNGVDHDRVAVHGGQAYVERVAHGMSPLTGRPMPTAQPRRPRRR